MPAQAQQLWLLLAPAAPLQWLGRTRPGVSVPRRAPGVITRQRLRLLPRDCLSSTLPAAPAEAMLSASRASARGENVQSWPGIKKTEIWRTHTVSSRFHKPRRAGTHRFLARASFGFGRNHMIYRPISVEGGFTMISRHEGPDLGRPSTLITRFSLGNSI